MKRIWRGQSEVLERKKFPLNQEIVFASTGTKHPKEAADKYVSAAGRLRYPNQSPRHERRHSGHGRQDRYPHGRPASAGRRTAEIDPEVDFRKMEEVLMEEGLKKFADPQKVLLQADRRKAKKTAGRLRAAYAVQADLAE